MYKDAYEKLELTHEQKRILSETLEDMIRREKLKEANPNSFRGGKIIGLQQALNFITGRLETTNEFEEN